MASVTCGNVGSHSGLRSGSPEMHATRLTARIDACLRRRNMTAPAMSPEEPMDIHHFVLVTEGVDLLEWPTLDALFEAGCGDAIVGHDTLEFDREAQTRDEALCSALRDAESVPGLRVVTADC